MNWTYAVHSQMDIWGNFSFHLIICSLL